MLFDPKRMKQWEAKPVSNLEALAAWLDTQPGSRKYSYYDAENCAVAEFIKATRPGEDYELRGDELTDFVEGQNVLMFGRRTYGALRRRIRIRTFVRRLKFWRQQEYRVYVRLT